MIIYRTTKDRFELLILHRVGYPRDDADWAWTPPGGGRIDGESPLECALRELKEETGIELDSEATLTSLVDDWYFFQKEVQTTNIVIDTAEHDDYRWMSLEEALELCSPQVVSNALASAYGNATKDRSILEGFYPRAALLDLDGTLIKNDHTLSDLTKKMLMIATEVGVTPLFVTARPPRAMCEIVDLTSIAPISVLMNGAMIFDCKNRTIVDEEKIGERAALEAVSRLKREMPGTVFGVQRGFDLHVEPGYRPSWPSPDNVSFGPAEDYITQPVTEILARNPEMSPKEFLAEVRAIASDLVEVTTSSRTGLVEMTKRGVSKGSGAVRLLKMLNIDAENAVAFGDMPTDIEMVSLVGLGVAVANAHPDLLYACDIVCASNEQDGPASILEELISKRLSLAGLPIDK
ncbi:MAG: HAD hydrolase family protein [Acidimicrobiaceae bacterium]|nr:HAD hydrolase family protein [Acidimicrobiaceae bacterium]